MQYIGDLIKIFIPSAIVLYGMYSVVKSFIDKQIIEKEISIKQKNNEIVTPIRLQAYERMVLFLERITPNNLLIRLGERGIQVLDFQQVLLKEIREEYNHNLSQQLYMSHEVWEKVKAAMNDVVTLINTSASEVKTDEPAINLSKKIFEKIISENRSTTSEALKALKSEIQEIW